MEHFRRDGNGIPHVRAADEAGLWRGLGYAHGRDRGLQMLLMRLLGQGRASEFLDAGDETLAIDVFFRRMNWGGRAPRGELPDRERALCAAYCEGVNRAFAERRPWELKLLGCPDEPWSLGDILLLSRMAGYVTLAQSQGEMERLVVQMVQAGVGRPLLEELFPGHLEGLDEDLLRKVKVGDCLVPAHLLWGAAVPRLTASNNWVVSGRMTASGKAMLANDPHLEVNRLPAVWCEVVLEAPGRYAMGATMPGLPAVIIGRTPDLAWGVTYGFMDAVDSWVEDCRDGKCRRGKDGWVDFRTRREVIRRKGRPPAEVTFYENDHGVLDGDPREPGFYLATRWSASDSGVASVRSFLGLWSARSVREGMDLVGRVESAWNFVLADREGNIGYQMSGLMPRRRAGWSGLVPVAGWDEANDWQGFVSPEDLPRACNPEEGFFATANQDLGAFGKVRPQNLPMAPYRADRIADLLREGTKLGVEDMFRIQFDVRSSQAEAFMNIARPLLPDTPQGRALRDWDGAYGPESKGAFLFEWVYRALLWTVFGEGGLGLEVVQYLWNEAGTFADFHYNFDRVLLSKNSAWFRGEPRDAVYRRVAEKALTVQPMRAWGEVQQVTLAHLLFGGRLPRFLGFDRGPVVIRGGRATVHQGQVYRSAGRATSFAPSYRFVTDFARDEARSALCGGPSDRRFSKWYASDVSNWLEGRYKTLAPE